MTSIRNVVVEYLDDHFFLLDHQLIICRIPSFFAFKEKVSPQLLSELGESILHLYTEQFVLDTPLCSQEVINLLVCDGSVSLCFYEDTLVGCAFLSSLGLNVYELFSVVVAESYQKRGIGKALIKHLLPSDFEIVRFITQNPCLYAILESFCDTIVPSPGEPIVSDLYRIAVPSLGMVDLRTFVFSPFPDPLKKIPSSRNKDINAWFHTFLEIDSDEKKSKKGFVCIGSRL